jgi:hypothetical protein
VQDRLNNTFKPPSYAKSKAEKAHRAARNNMAEGALKLFKIKMIPRQPRADPRRLMLYNLSIACGNLLRVKDRHIPMETNGRDKSRYSRGISASKIRQDANNTGR